MLCIPDSITDVRDGRKEGSRYASRRHISPPAKQDAHQHAPRIIKAEKFKHA